MKKILPLSGKILVSLLAIFILSVTMQWIVDGLEEKGYAIVAIMINVSFPILVFFLVRIFNKKYNRIYACDYGFVFTKFSKKMVTGILAATLVIVCIVLASAFFGVSFEFIELQKNAMIPLLQMIAGAWFFGAWEEMYFRGLVFNTLLKGKLNFHIAALITAILFTALHAGTYDMTETTPFWFVVVILLSYILLYLYIVTQSIWAPIGFHFTWDFLWSVMNDAENKVGLFRVNQYSSHGILMDNISIPVLTVTLVMLLYISRKKKGGLLPGHLSMK